VSASISASAWHRGDFTRWLYRGGRPNRLSAFLNRIWAALFSTGIARDYLVTLAARPAASPSRVGGSIR
jgi:hypothetical protein